MDPFIKPIHDALEQTKLAKSLADGTVTPRMYREYLRNSLVVWEALENNFPEYADFNVASHIHADLALTAPDAYEDESVHWRAELQALRANGSDLYVLGLGLCYGGKQMARNIQKNSNLSVRHFRMPKDAIARLRKLEPTSSGVASAFQDTLAWYHDVT